MTSLRRIPRVYALFFGTLLAATGYGATFVLNRHYKTLGGDEVDTGTVLMAAMIGTLISVPVVGWYVKQVGAARLAATELCCCASGFVSLPQPPQST